MHAATKGSGLPYYVTPPRSERVQWLSALAALAAMVSLALASGWTAVRPIPVLVDGRALDVPVGSTVGDLVRGGMIAATPGDLLGVDGSIAAYGAGEAAVVTCNGSIAADAQRLRRGDVVESRMGANVRESIVTSNEPVPFVTSYQGEGPLVEFKTLGAPGVRRVTRGEVSGFELTSTVLAEPSDMVIVRSRPSSGRLVALTFDDGPFPGQTERVLNVLKRHKVKATFFMLGIQAQRHRGLARRVVREGHSVGSHTYSHVRLGVVPSASAKRECLVGRKAVKSATGVDSVWLRPPYGELDSPSWRVIRGLGMRAVLWDVDSEDWKRAGAKQIAWNVMRDTKPGSVILMHDGGGDRLQTVQALNLIIPRLKKSGYTFVTVDELVRARSAAAKRKPAVRPASTSAPRPARSAGG